MWAMSLHSSDRREFLKAVTALGVMGMARPSGTAVAAYDPTATFDVANKGNAHVFAVPRLAILDANHKLVAKAQAPEKRYFPGQKDGMKVTWSGTLAPGDYVAILTLVYGRDLIETKEVRFQMP